VPVPFACPAPAPEPEPDRADRGVPDFDLDLFPASPLVSTPDVVGLEVEGGDCFTPTPGTAGEAVRVRG
jgi:hypothetical protein